MTSLQRVLKNYLSLSGAEIIAQISGTLLFIYVARSLGASVFGQLGFASAYIYFFNVLANFELNTLGIREIAKNKEKTGVYGTSILILQLLLAFFMILGLFLTLLFLPLDRKIKLITFIFGLGMIPNSLNMSYVFQAHEKMEFVAFVKLTVHLAYFILGALLIYIFKEITVLPVVWVIALFMGSLVSLYFLKRGFHFSLERVKRSEVRALFLSALPFVVAASLGTIYHKFDLVFIQFLKGETQVGYYSSGYRIVNLLLALGSFVSSAFFPLISASYVKDASLFRRYSNLLAQVVGLGAIPFALGGFLLAKETLIKIYGSEFISGVAPFRILISLPAIIMLNTCLASVIIVANQQKHNTVSVAIGAFVNLVFNLLLIPTLGIVGAAYATVVAEISVGSYLLIIFSRKLKFLSEMLRHFILKPLISSLIMGSAIILLSSFPLFIKILIGTVVYFLSVFLIKGFPKPYES